jgi:nucleotide-binding universal stress UspA family protein
LWHAKQEVAVFHRILVGVDDSPAACLALERAIELAEEGHGRIGLLTSAPQPANVIWAGPIAVPQSRAGMCAQLDNWACQCIEAAIAAVPPEVPVVKLISHGDPAKALLQEAERGDWDLVVVGEAKRRRRLPFQRPVAERLRNISIPVLVVPAEPEPDQGAPAAPRPLPASLLNKADDRLLGSRARPGAGRATRP